ncbi:MAG: 50S ribosomal protein L25 [Syntrophomonadaceae bacterium]|nr:50S ribosomal protein L25 [Syntrophomonadaceae bacterium]
MAVTSPLLACQKRELNTKSHLKQLKRENKIPAIIYGKGQANITITLDGRQVIKTFNTHGARGIFSLEISGESKPVMAVIRDMQRDPLSGQIIHMDFMAVNMSEKFTSLVPVVILGEEEASKSGGIVQYGLKEIEVECLPQDLPENITYDISNLEIGSNITVADLEAPAGVEFLSSPDAVVVTILAPSKSTSEDEELEEGEEGTEETQGE